MGTMFAFLALIAITISSIGVAHADYGYVKSTPPIEYGNTSTNATGTNSIPFVNVCVFQPVDFTMDSSLSDLILAEVQHDNVTGTIVNFIDQAFHNYNCGHVIKIDRAINNNYRYTERTTKYQVSGNILSVYVYKTNNPLQALDPANAMTNWDCERQAQTTTYQSDYHISQSGYVDTYTGCNPYHSNHSVSSELPVNVIKHSVDVGLKKLGL
jgi:hypothetical protein